MFLLTENKNNNLEKARDFCREVKELNKKYKMSFFFVTEGASATQNNGNPAVRACREALIDWEKKNGGDPDEDWSKKE